MYKANRISQLGHICVLILVLLWALSAHALEQPGEELGQLALSTQRGAQVDLTTRFKTVNGEEKSLKELMIADRPAIIVPVYFHCPRMCGLSMSGVAKLSAELDLYIGHDYSIFTVSFDPADSVETAAQRAKQFHTAYREPEAARRGWHFLVGDQPNINALMTQIGFHYAEDKGEFAHTAAIMVLTPSGKISQFFAGISYSAPDVRLALVEASNGRVGTVIDQVMLFCFRFDPTKGRYTWAAFNLMRLGGALTFLFLVVVITVLIRRERAQRRASSGGL